MTSPSRIGPDDDAAVTVTASESESTATKLVKKNITLTQRSQSLSFVGQSVSGGSGLRQRFVAPQSMDDYDEENIAAARPTDEATMQEEQSLMNSLGKGTSTRMKTSSIQKIPLAEKEDFISFHFRWYYAIYLFSTVSLIACLLQLFTGPPFGVWMTSSEVEEIGGPEWCRTFPT